MALNWSTPSFLIRRRRVVSSGLPYVLEAAIARLIATLAVYNLIRACGLIASLVPFEQHSRTGGYKECS